MRETPSDRSPNLFYQAVLVCALLLGIDAAITVLLTDSQQKLIYSDVISPLFDLLATVVLVIAARDSATHSRRLGIAWGLIALSIFAYALGDLSWGIMELGLDAPPFPSIADVFYLAYYPLLLTAVFLFPERALTRGEQIHKVVDMGIVMVAALLGFWNYLIGPMASSNAGSPWLELTILLAYPAGDLVLLWALLRIAYKVFDRQREDRAPAFLLAASIVVMIFADGIYTYQTLLGTYMSGSALDLLWRITVLIAGLAGVSQIAAIRSLNRTGIFPEWFHFLDGWKKAAPYFPYLWLVAAYLLLVRSHMNALPMDFLTLSLGVGAIIGLVLFRQIITLSENHKLNEALKLQTQELQNEIVERTTVERQLMHDSLHDAMTDLPNRVLFLDRLGQAIEYCKRREQDTFSVLFVDIDQFKVINDSLGHLTGDELLVAVSKRMKESLRSSDTVARFGGDEFAILLQITGEKDSALAIAEKIQQTITRPLQLDEHELHITASIGVVTDIVGYDHPEDVLRDADIAMYQAKALGKARSITFSPQMRSAVFSRLQMEQDLRLALEYNEFQLYYQPIVSMRSNQVVSFEALIRWCHPRRGLLLPNDFLGIAEESGLIVPMGRWILQEACSQLKQWHENYPELENISMNVNVSNRQFAQPNFVAEVVEALRRNQVDPRFLKLEITESVLISNYAAANVVFTQLRNLGIELQIDDFGSGYSALGYLQHFPISAVKIDKSFVDEIGKGRRGAELIRAIVSMTRELGMETIAEGIETIEQLNEIKNLSCPLAQGFLLSKPLDRATVEKLLQEQAIRISS